MGHSLFGGLMSLLISAPASPTSMLPLTLYLSHSHHTANLTILSGSPSCGGLLLLLFCCCGLMGGSDGEVSGWVGKFWVVLLRFWVGSNEVWVSFCGSWLVAACRRGGSCVYVCVFFSK